MPDITNTDIAASIKRLKGLSQQEWTDFKLRHQLQDSYLGLDARTELIAILQAEFDSMPERVVSVPSKIVEQLTSHLHQGTIPT